MNKKIGMFGAISTGVGMLIATSCFISSASGASAVGTPFVIAIVIACIANMMAVLSIAELNAIMPNLTGGIAQYTLAGLGPLITIITMVGGYLISNVFAAPAEGAMFANIMAELAGDSIPPEVFSVGITVILVVVNLMGVNMSTVVQEVVATFMVKKNVPRSYKTPFYPVSQAVGILLQVYMMLHISTDSIQRMNIYKLCFVLFAGLCVYSFFWVKYRLKISLFKGVGIHQVMTMESPAYHSIKRALAREGKKL